MKTATKERPILFRGELVRSILSGRKTQTRRVIDPQPNADTRGWWLTVSSTDRGQVGTWSPRNAKLGYSLSMSTGEPVKCPYGVEGDRLWVRETWTPDHAAFYPHAPYVYRADAGHDYERNERGEVYSPEADAWFPYRWRPSIHMPRRVSRLSLLIKSVRVERLNDITEADAKAEGIEHASGDAKRWKDYTGQAQSLFNPINSFCSLWQSINGAGSWDANPWVWVLEFERVTDA